MENRPHPLAPAYGASLYLIVFVDESGIQNRLQSGIEEHALRWLRHATECKRYPAFVTKTDVYIETRSKSKREADACENLVVGENFCTHCKLERKDYKWKT